MPPGVSLPFLPRGPRDKVELFWLCQARAGTCLVSPGTSQHTPFEVPMLNP